MKKKRLIPLFASVAACFALSAILFTPNTASADGAVDLSSHQMVNGASIRIATDAGGVEGTGIRFMSLMDEGQYIALENAYGDGVDEDGTPLAKDGDTTSYHMVIMPKKYVATYGDLTAENLFGDSAVYALSGDEGNFGNASGVKTLNYVTYDNLYGLNYDDYGRLINEGYYGISTYMEVPEAGYVTELVAKAFVRYSTDGGSTYQYALCDYAENEIDNNTRSVGYTAQRLLVTKPTRYTTHVEHYVPNGTEDYKLVYHFKDVDGMELIKEIYYENAIDRDEPLSKISIGNYEISGSGDEAFIPAGFSWNIAEPNAVLESVIYCNDRTEFHIYYEPADKANTAGDDYTVLNGAFDDATAYEWVQFHVTSTDAQGNTTVTSAIQGTLETELAIKADTDETAKAAKLEIPAENVDGNILALYMFEYEADGPILVDDFAKYSYVHIRLYSSVEGLMIRPYGYAKTWRLSQGWNNVQISGQVLQTAVNTTDGLYNVNNDMKMRFIIDGTPTVDDGAGNQVAATGNVILSVEDVIGILPRPSMTVGQDFNVSSVDEVLTNVTGTDFQAEIVENANGYTGKSLKVSREIKYNYDAEGNIQYREDGNPDASWLGVKIKILHEGQPLTESQFSMIAVRMNFYMEPTEATVWFYNERMAFCSGAGNKTVMITGWRMLEEIKRSPDAYNFETGEAWFQFGGFVYGNGEEQSAIYINDITLHWRTHETASAMLSDFSLVQEDVVYPEYFNYSVVDSPLSGGGEAWRIETAETNEMQGGAVLIPLLLNGMPLTEMQIKQWDYIQIMVYAGENNASDETKFRFASLEPMEQTLIRGQWNTIKIDAWDFVRIMNLYNGHVGETVSDPQGVYPDLRVDVNPYNYNDVHSGGYGFAWFDLSYTFPGDVFYIENAKGVFKTETDEEYASYWMPQEDYLTMPIGAYNAMPQTSSTGVGALTDGYYDELDHETLLQYYKEIGVTMLMGLYNRANWDPHFEVYMLELCEQYGMSYLSRWDNASFETYESLTTNELGWQRPGEAENYDWTTEAEVLARLMQYDSFAGIMLQDEPGRLLFDDMAIAQEAFKQVITENGGNAAEYLYHGNLLPNWASSYTLYTMYAQIDDETNAWLKENGDTVSSYTYQQYVDDYIATYQPQVLSFDFYPMANTVENNKDNNLNILKDGYFDNLAVIREASIKANIPFWTYIQTCSWNIYQRLPSANELWWNVNTSLAFGAKGIQYFCGVEPWNADDDPNSEYAQNNEFFDGGLFLRDGTPTEIYSYLVDINKHIKGVDDILMQSRSIGLMQSGNTPALNDGTGNNMTWPTSATACNLTSFRELSSVEGNAIVGCFDYNGKTVLYVVNNDIINTPADGVDITLNFNSAVSGYTIRYGEKSPLAATAQQGYMTCALGPGEGMLVVLGEEETQDVGVNGGWYTQEGIMSAKQLLTPIVSVDESGLATWAKIFNALEYGVVVDGVAVGLVEGNSYLLQPGESIQVIAVGDGEVYYNSNYSEVKKYVATLAAPTVTMDMLTGEATWTEVANATGYKYRINGGTPIETATPLTVTLDVDDAIEVMAIGDGGDAYYDSAYSAVQTRAEVLMLDDFKDATAWLYAAPVAGTSTQELATVEDVQTLKVTGASTNTFNYSSVVAITRYAGVGPTLEQLQSYQYLAVNVYADTATTLYFFTQPYTLSAGWNTVKITPAQMTEQLALGTGDWDYPALLFNEDTTYIYFGVEVGASVYFKSIEAVQQPGNTLVKYSLNDGDATGATSPESNVTIEQADGCIQLTSSIDWGLALIPLYINGEMATAAQLATYSEICFEVKVLDGVLDGIINWADTVNYDSLASSTNISADDAWHTVSISAADIAANYIDGQGLKICLRIHGELSLYVDNFEAIV